MAEQDFLIYWTDGLNPPRRLALGGAGVGQELPFPSLQALFNDEEEDLNNYDVYRFSSRYSYSIGTNYPVASTGGGALFANLPVGTNVAMGPTSVYFRKQGIRANASYSVRAGISAKGTILESAGSNFDYNLCNSGGFRSHGILSFLHTTQSHFVYELGTGQSVFVLSDRQGGGVLFMFPCIWWPPSGPMMRNVRISGTVAIPRNVPFTVDPRYPTTYVKVWPPDDDPEAEFPGSIPLGGPYADPPAPPVVESIVKSENTSGASQTSATISLPGAIAAGDMLIIAVAGDSLHPGEIPGWKKVQSAWSRDSARGRERGDLRVTTELYQRVADGSEGASVTIQWENPQSWVAWAIRISGDHTGEVFYSNNALTAFDNQILCSAVPNMLPSSPLFQIAAVNDYNSTIQWSESAGYTQTERVVISNPNLFTAGLAQATQPQAVRQANGTYTLTTLGPNVTFPGAPDNDNVAMAALAFGVKSKWSPS